MPDGRLWVEAVGQEWLIPAKRRDGRLRAS
jgi:hypothetical protein